MSQTNWIAAYLLLGFIVYVIAKGQVQQFEKIIGI